MKNLNFKKIIFKDLIVECEWSGKIGFFPAQ